MNILRTPAMKDAFSHSVTDLTSSFQILLSRSTDDRILFLYRSNCSSAVGTLRRHSSITFTLAIWLEVRNRSWERFARWVMEFCSFSSRCGKARFSNKSKTVRRSRGWSSSKSEKDPLRERFPGVGGLEGVLTESAEAEVVVWLELVGYSNASDRVPPSEGGLPWSAMSRESDSSISKMAFVVDELRLERGCFDLVEDEWGNVLTVMTDVD